MLRSHPSSAPTRRLLAGLAALAVGLVGCGGDDEQADPSSPSSDTTIASDTSSAPSATDGATTSPTPSTSGEAGATDAFPLTVEHAYGTTEVPAEPVRVVTVGYNDQDPVLALGVVPVGVMPWYEDQPIGFDWTMAAYGGALPEQVGGAEFLEINFEEVAALQPDLIVGASGMREIDYDLAAQIAPTIPQPPGEAEYSSAPWQDTQRHVGAALGRSALADEVIATVEAQIDEARAAHPEFADATAIVAEVYEGQFAVRGSSEVWSEFLVDMGFTVPEDLVGPDYTEISSEEVGRFGDLDALVWLSEPDEVAANPLYPGLAVTTDGRDIYIDAFGDLSGAIGFNSALSLPIVVEQLVPKLAAAIDGDPATAVPT